MVRYLERADQGIQHLNALIERLNEEAVAVNGPAQGLDGSKRYVVDFEPEGFLTGCATVVGCLLDALATLERGVYRLPPSRPPVWWRKLKSNVADKGSEYAATYSALIHAVDTLNRHVRDEDSRVGLLVFLVDDLKRKVMRSSISSGFRSVRDRKAERITFVFDIKVHDYVDASLLKLLDEANAFPKPCTDLLTAARNEVGEVFRHFGLPEI